jgi:hypothetical protein
MGATTLARLLFRLGLGRVWTPLFIFRPLRPICILVRTRILFDLCMIWIFVCIFGYFDSWSLYGYIICSFVGSIVNLCNCCYSIPPASRARSNVHEAPGGAFPKRHRVDCGVFAIICKVSVLGRHMPPRHPFFIGKNQVTFQNTIFLLLHALCVFLGASVVFVLLVSLVCLFAAINGWTPTNFFWWRCTRFHLQRTL